MKKDIDARGLSCPQPVILTKKALDEHDEVCVIVDNNTACENVKRMATHLGCEVDIEQKNGDIYIHIKKVSTCKAVQDESVQTGPVVLVIASDKMGRGEDILGNVLIKSFMHTLIEASPQPEIIIFLNTGVKLTVKGSEVMEDLKALADKGIKILVCGTCLGYFELKDLLEVGTISNMYDITNIMLSAGRLLQV